MKLYKVKAGTMVVAIRKDNKLINHTLGNDFTASEYITDEISYYNNKGVVYKSPKYSDELYKIFCLYASVGYSIYPTDSEKYPYLVVNHMDVEILA